MHTSTALATASTLELNQADVPVVQQTTATDAPRLLDQDLLAFVAGGGPAGGWSEGPHGGW